MVALAIVDLEAVVALARSDQITLAAARAIEGEPLDLGRQAVLADAGDQSRARARVGFRADLPDADVLLGEVQLAVLVVGDAAFGRRVELEGAHAPGAHGAARV